LFHMFFSHFRASAIPNGLLTEIFSSRPS
jgi:hypothetical protein